MWTGRSSLKAGDTVHCSMVSTEFFEFLDREHRGKRWRMRERLVLLLFFVFVALSFVVVGDSSPV